MPLTELLTRLGGDPMEWLQALVGLHNNGMVAYDAVTMMVDLTQLGELVNLEPAGHA